jgi:hypothetical protein
MIVLGKAQWLAARGAGGWVRTALLDSIGRPEFAQQADGLTNIPTEGACRR